MLRGRRVQTPGLKAANLLFLASLLFGMCFNAAHGYALDTSSLTRGCEKLSCSSEEQCVSRKFWCINPPCSSMTYCSKSRKESLKGPESCEKVLCSPGFKCLVRVQDCEWNEKCRHRATRCLADWEVLQEAPTCADVACPTGHACLLREYQCSQSPCKLAKICARSREVQVLHAQCKQLGCRSEHECFLRRPADKCTKLPCNYVPACLSAINRDNENSPSNVHCRGWICPEGQQCHAHLESSCRAEYCPVMRSCHHRLLRAAVDDDSQPADLLSEPTTFVDFEQPQMRPSNFSDLTDWTQLMHPSASNKVASPLIVDVAKYENTGPEVTTKKKRVTEVTKSHVPTFTPWLDYLKRRAGSEAVQYWVQKASNNEDYEGFREWLESMQTLLGPETYRAWLREVRIASADLPAFQAWLPGPGAPERRPLPGSTPEWQAPRFTVPREYVGGLSIWQSPYLYQPGHLQAYYPAYPGAYPRPLGNLTSGSPQMFYPSSLISWGPYSPFAHAPPSHPAEGSWRPERPPTGQALPETLSPPTQLPNEIPELLRIVPRMQSLISVDEPTKAAPVRPADSNLNTQLQRKLNLLPLFNDSSADGIKTILDYIAGLRLNQTTSQTTEPKFIKMTYNEENQPNLLIYFPPPLNFFIYHNIKGQNKSSIINPIIEPNGSGYEIKFESLDKESSGITKTENEKNLQSENSTSTTEKIKKDICKGCTKPSNNMEISFNEKELDYIRKIIKEFVEYWEEKEKFEDDSANSSKRLNGKINNILSFQTDKIISRDLSQNQRENSSQVSFDEFLDWLSKNSSILTLLELCDDVECREELCRFLQNCAENFFPQPLDYSFKSVQDRKIRKKMTPEFDELNENTKSDENIADDRKLMHSFKDSKQVRVLVDINKDPELIKMLLSHIKKDSDGPDHPEYQVVVNLNDVIDPNEENRVSRRLIDLASKHLHRNITNNQTIPKMMWVFPIFNADENKTAIQRIQNINDSKAKISSNRGRKSFNETLYNSFKLFKDNLEASNQNTEEHGKQISSHTKSQIDETQSIEYDEGNDSDVKESFSDYYYDAKETDYEV